MNFILWRTDFLPLVGAWCKRKWQEWRYYILFFFFVWVPLRSAVIDYNPVPTGSMNPTILEGDVVWVNKLAYGLRLPLTQIHLAQWADPKRGDIVVVLSPEDGTRLVKRVVGVPGDTLAMQDRTLMLNGQPVGYHQAGADYDDRFQTQAFRLFCGRGSRRSGALGDGAEYVERAEAELCSRRRPAGPVFSARGFAG
jgi:signal peptidase I